MDSRTNCVRISGIPRDTDAESLRSFFEIYGKIVRVELSGDSACVEFADVSSAAMLWEEGPDLVFENTKISLVNPLSSSESHVVVTHNVRMSIQQVSLNQNVVRPDPFVLPELRVDVYLDMASFPIIDYDDSREFWLQVLERIKVIAKYRFQNMHHRYNVHVYGQMEHMPAFLLEVCEDFGIPIHTPRVAEHGVQLAVDMVACAFDRRGIAVTMRRLISVASTNPNLGYVLQQCKEAGCAVLLLQSRSRLSLPDTLMSFLQPATEIYYLEDVTMGTPEVMGGVAPTDSSAN
jgi:hypothetical protein